jgi:hypothetical protein
MQGLWYGDKRDRVKWGALVHLANTKGIHCIVQVAYFRHGTDLKLHIGEKEVPLPIDVWNHFSDLKNIKRLEEKTNIKITVLDQEFSASRRDHYIDEIVSKLRDLNCPKIVFLDPDTRIVPKNLRSEHFAREEIKKVWNDEHKALSNGELLVIYQHADRSKKWIRDRKNTMESACGGADIGIITGIGIASDVAMLWCRKGSSAKLDPKQEIAIPEPPRSFRKKKMPRPCAHQCGELTKGGYFCPGHDAKLKSIFLKVSGDKINKKELDKNIRKMYEIWKTDQSKRLIDIAREVLG